MAPLKVVCLISGGKDSLFSILHCLQNGHEVIALANLHPPVARAQDADEDLDSYMYQTVGHKIIPLYEQALGLPLHRQEIAGSAVNRSKSYSQTATGLGEHEDETESLVPLLRKVKHHHPEVNAVSTGAILSDYQRTRVESVAARLGLTPLSYLWQWPNIPPHTQRTLLEDMNAAGQDSRIVKVASGGLDSSFLWCNVADPRTINRLDKAVQRFGSGDDGAVLGEGGEYETLAIAGPAPLWKGRIQVEEDDVQSVAGEAGSASVSIRAAQVIEQDSGRGFAGARIPPLLEPQFLMLLEVLGNPDAKSLAPGECPASPPSTLPDHICYQDLTGPAGKSVAEQMIAIMASLSRLLQLHNPSLDFTGIAYVSIILRNIGDFATVNASYTAAFTEPNPPARITLAEPSVVPEGKDVLVSLTCIRDPARLRQGLHVQSQSYWAPANIGPYSQAISVPLSSAEVEDAQRMLYVAGQIPLNPASMELAWPQAASGDLDAFVRQAVLAAQHFVRIGRTMQVKRWACGVAFITAMSAEDAEKKASVVRKTWEGLHQSLGEAGDGFEEEHDDEAFDVWNVTHGTQRAPSHALNTSQSQVRPSSGRAGEVPQLVVIQVTALPRAASVEWATYGLTTTSGSTPRIPHFEHLLEMFKDRTIR